MTKIFKRRNILSGSGVVIKNKECDAENKKKDSNEPEHGVMEYKNEPNQACVQIKIKKQDSGMH